MSRPKFPIGTVLTAGCIRGIRERQRAYDRDPEEYECLHAPEPEPMQPEPRPEPRVCQCPRCGGEAYEASYWKIDCPDCGVFDIRDCEEEGDTDDEK